MSSASVNEDYGVKKFQLTDSLLRRSLSYEEADNVEIIEPAIVTSEFNKQLKGKGYKHAVLSCQNLYVVNTPAKQDTDLLLNIPLNQVVNVSMILDIPDFLQGELREQAQHVQVKFKNMETSVSQELLLRAESLSLLSLNITDSTPSKKSSTRALPKPVSKDSNDNYLHGSSNARSNGSYFVGSSHMVGVRNTDSARLSSLVLEKNLKNSKKSKESSLTSGKKSRKSRPLPQPIIGTEKLNASYTNAFEMTSGQQNSTGSTGKQSPSMARCLSPSRSMDNLTIKDNRVDNLTSSSSKVLHSSYPFHSSLSQSWNDILKTQQHSTTRQLSMTESTSSATPHFKERHNSLNENHLSNSLNQSLSSKVFRLFKGSTEHVDSDVFSQSNITSTTSTRSDSIQSVEGSSSGKVLDEKVHEVDIYTLSKNSRLYNALREAWIHSLIKATLSNGKTINDKKTKASSKKLATKLENDAMVNKFLMLKEEILQCDQDEQLFLLTKEINFACQHYLSIKKMIWKSSNLIKFYLRKMKCLHSSKESYVIERMDELDLLIMIGELMVNLFQGSEMFIHRNAFINENSGSFIKDLVLITLQRLSLKYSSKSVTDKNLDSEVDELQEAWLNTSISLLYEVMTVASQLNWCLQVDKKSFDTSILVEMLTVDKKDFVVLLDHVMKRITFELTNDFELILTSENFILFYKQLSLISFVFTYMNEMALHIKTTFQEEIKYYICKSHVTDHLPTRFPISCIVKDVLHQVIKYLKD